MTRDLSGPPGQESDLIPEVTRRHGDLLTSWVQTSGEYMARLPAGAMARMMAHEGRDLWSLNISIGRPGHILAILGPGRAEGELDLAFKKLWEPLREEVMATPTRWLPLLELKAGLMTRGKRHTPEN